MAEYKLSNPLSIEEKLQVPRLIGHDAGSVLAIILNDVLVAQERNDCSELKKTPYLVQHIGLINETINLLALSNEYDLHHLRDYFDDFRLDDEFNRLNALVNAFFKGRNVSFSNEIPQKFLSEENLIHCVLYNFCKNAFERGGAKNVEISVKEHSTLQDIVYSPEGSLDYTDFVGFHVHDNGRGFPSGEDLREHFTKAPKRGERGFGLYFVGLAAKVLRGQVGIKSEQGNTTVSFYHPVYLNLKQNK